MRSFIFSQCRNFRTGVTWEDFGVLVTARAREIWMFWSFFYLRLWKIIVQWVSVIKFRMNDGTWRWYWQFWSQDKNEDSEVHQYDNSKILREQIFGKRKWGLQNPRRLKPVHIAYVLLLWPAQFGRKLVLARDVIGRDRDETETLTIFLETRPRRDVGTSRDRDVETETTTLLRWVCYRVIVYSTVTGSSY